MNSTEVQNPQRKLYAYHNWFRWLTILSVALMLALCTLSCCCLYNVSEALILAMCSFMFLPVYSLFKMFQKISCLPCVFDSVLACAKPAHACVSEALLPALQTLSLSFLTNSSSYSKAFQHFIAFSGSPTAVPCFPFLWCEGMATVINWPLHVHLRCYTVGVPFSDT